MKTLWNMPWDEVESSVRATFSLSLSLHWLSLFYDVCNFHALLKPLLFCTPFPLDCIALLSSLPLIHKTCLLLSTEMKTRRKNGRVKHCTFNKPKELILTIFFPGQIPIILQSKPKFQHLNGFLEENAQAV